MSNHPGYWPEIRKLRAELLTSHPDGVDLIEVNRRNARIVRVIPSVAAKCLVDGTHRMATSEELASHAATERMRSRSVEALNRHWQREHGGRKYIVQFGKGSRT